MSSSQVKQLSGNWRLDGAFLDALNRTSPISNSQTGLGTSRDKNSYTTVNETYQLGVYELEDLFRQSRIIQKIVRLIPTDATVKWGELTAPKGQDPDTSQYEEYEEKLDIQQMFGEAGSDARHHGNSFLIIGLDDGLMWDEPVDENRINTINWLHPLNRYDLHIDTTNSTYRDPEHYLFSLDQRKWPDEELPRRIHKSRVLRFCGVRLTELSRELTGGYDDSIIQAVYSSFVNYLSAIGASSGMVQDYSVFTYGLDGLSQMMSAQTPEERETVTAQLQHRFMALQMGMSTNKGLMFDKEREAAGFINRTYAGVEAIVEKLFDLLVTESGLPRTKLIGTSDQGVFSESGQSDRYEYAALVASYQREEFTRNLKTLQRYIFAASDGPGESLDGIGWEWLDTLQLTRHEEAELRKLHSETDEKYKAMKVLHPMEIRRSRFSAARYGLEITIEEEFDDVTETPDPVIAPAAEPRDDDTPGGFNADSVSVTPASELLRVDALDGLVPMEVYWEAIGLDAGKMRASMDKQARRNSAGYWNEEEY